MFGKRWFTRLAVWVSLAGLVIALVPAGPARAAGGEIQAVGNPGSRLGSVLFLQQEQLGRQGLHRGLLGLADARWVDEGTAKATWVNAGRRFELRFRKTAGPALGRLQLPDATGATMELVGARPVPGRVQGETVVYRNILPQIDLLFSLASDGFKESLVIKKLIGEPVYRFHLDLAGVTPEVRDKEIVFRNSSTGRPAFTIPAPFMTDAAGAVSNDIGMAVEPDAGGYLLTLRPSQAWLTDPARVYPVIVDPSLALWPGQLGFEPYWSYFDLPLDDRGSVSVNLFNGNLVVKYLDTYHTSQGPATFLERTYNAQDNTNGTLGYNWVHNYFGFVLENADGSVTYTDADGTRTVFTRDPDGAYSAPPGVYARLARNVDAVGAVTFALEHIPSHLLETFDSSGNLVARTDSSGNTTAFAHAGGVLTSVTDASGGQTRFDNTAPDGGVVRVTDPAGRVFDYHRNASGDLTAVTDPTGAAVLMTYDAAHRLTALTDARSQTTSFSYDASGRVIAVTPADGSVWMFGYDAAANTATVAAPDGKVYAYAFNSSANLTQKTEPGGLVSAYAWDGNQSLLSITNPGGGLTLFTYNQWGQKLTQTDPNGKVTTFQYDANGNLVNATDPEQSGLAVAYDADDNPTSLTDSAGSTVNLAYDNRGNNTGYTDAGGSTTTYAYDASGNLTQAVDPLGGVASYTYDAGNRLTSAAVTQGGTTYLQAGYAYDALDRLVGVTDGLGRSTTQTYDSGGNLVGIARPNGRQVGYTYGPTNALTAVSDDGAGVAAMDYDLAGNLVSMTVAGLASPFTYTYNAENRLASSTDAFGARLDYAHNTDGFVTGLAATLGTQTYSVAYAYDVKGRLLSLTEQGGQTVSYAYGANDRLAGATLPSGLTKQLTYDTASRVTEVRDTTAAGGVLWSQAYTYDAAGNRTTVAAQGGALTTYGYDAQNRLVSETDPATGQRTDYQYDPAGNRTLKAVYDPLGTLLSQTTYTYDLAGELTAVDGGTRAYDPAGNLLSDGQRTYAWDAENRLIEVRDQATGALVASFTYDGFGRRLSRTTAAGTVFYHYDGGKVTCETDDAGNILAAYTYGPDGGPATLRYQGQTYFYHTNDRGDVLGLTDASGAVFTSYRYDAWGKVLEATGSLAAVNPYRYAGYRQDDSTGLYHLKTRYYDAAIGRFLSQDALLGRAKDAGSLNRFVYAGNNPVTFVDSDGRASWMWRSGWQDWSCVRQFSSPPDRLGWRSAFSPLSLPSLRWLRAETTTLTERSAAPRSPQASSSMPSGRADRWRAR